MDESELEENVSGEDDGTVRPVTTLDEYRGMLGDAGDGSRGCLRAFRRVWELSPTESHKRGSRKTREPRWGQGDSFRDDRRFRFRTERRGQIGRRQRGPDAVGNRRWEPARAADPRAPGAASAPWSTHDREVRAFSRPG